MAWGVDAAEIDVRRTADKALIVHHDEHWQGRRLDCFSYGELVRHGAPIRRLDEVLAAADGHLALDVELKEPGYEADVVSALLAQIEPEHLIVTSFLDEAVQAVKVRSPALRTGLIVGSSAALHAPWTLLTDVFPFGRLSNCGADFLAPNVRLLATGLHRRAQRRGIPLLLWTVNDEEEVRRYLDDLSILGVVTDSPQTLANAHTTQSNIWPLRVSAQARGR